MIQFIKLELNVVKKGFKINGFNYKITIEFDINEIKIYEFWF